MSLLSSPAQGHLVLGWRRIAGTALVFCLLPALVGAGMVLATLVFGPEVLGREYLRVEGLATFAMISPLLTGPVWAVIGLGSAYLLRAGWFGSFPAALLGAAAYGVVAWMGGLGPFLLGFGAVSALIYRMALALQRPEAV